MYVCFLLERTFLLEDAVMAWNYRRYVLASMPVPRSEFAELAYTLKKIESELSNFSAWHQRSKVLTLLWSDGRLDPVESREAGTLRSVPERPR